jgi:hypothetical protein
MTSRRRSRGATQRRRLTHYDVRLSRVGRWSVGSTGRDVLGAQRSVGLLDPCASSASDHHPSGAAGDPRGAYERERSQAGWHASRREIAMLLRRVGEAQLLGG